MKRVAATLFVAMMLCCATLAHADKLAPPQNTLQPLSQNVQPAVSESVQRVASPQDIVTIQQSASSEPVPSVAIPQNGVQPQLNFVGSGPSFDSVALLTTLGIAVLIIGGIAWLWKRF